MTFLKADVFSGDFTLRRDDQWGNDRRAISSSVWQIYSASQVNFHAGVRVLFWPTFPYNMWQLSQKEDNIIRPNSFVSSIVACCRRSDTLLFYHWAKKFLHAQLLLPDSKSHEAHYGFTQKQLNKKHVLSFHSWRTQYTAKWMTLDTLNADVSGGDFTLWEDMSVEVMTGDRFAVVCGKYTKHHRSSFTQGWEVCFNLTPPIKSDNFLNKETMSSGQNILTWYIITCCRRSNK